MKTVLRNNLLKVFTAVVVVISASAAQAQTYTTRTNGNWNDIATWVNGLVPPSIVLPTMTININHNVSYNCLTDLSNSGTIRITNATGNFPVFTVPSGKNVNNLSTGKFYIRNAEYRQYRYVGGGNSGTAQSGSFTNDGGLLDINNSIVEIAEKFTNKGGGKRIFRKGILLTGDQYELKDAASIDTLDKVSVSVGWSSSGDFRISAGKIYFTGTRIQIAGTGTFNYPNGTASGDIDYITFKNHVTGVTGSGDLSVGPAATPNNLKLAAYCVYSSTKYKTNSKLTGAQTADCSLTYFPSTFMIQQANNLSSGLTFSDPVAIGTASLTAGAKYRFPLVNDSADAIVSIDSLIGGAKVENIDDNTTSTGYAFAFQPRVTSGNIIGRSYAVFTIKFVKTGTETPISLQYINATPLDIDGNSTLKEFAEVTMGTGSTMNYMSTTTDIAILNLAAGSFGAQNILGVERDNIDTLSYANMFTVSAANKSQFTIKYGTYTTAPSTTTRQFSLYMKGVSYPTYALLPVKLSSFTATLVNNKTNLKWKTDSEENLSHFIVDRSTDGINYSQVGMVFAYGTSATAKEYAFNDNVTGLSGIVYYRLRSVNVNTKEEFSEVRVVRIGKQDANIALLTYPNPVTSDLRVTLPANFQNKKVVFEVYSVNGSLAKQFQVANSGQTEIVNLDNLNSGMYIIKATCEGQTAQQKIIKQ